MKNKAEEIAQQLRDEYCLTYRSSVNLEAALNNAIRDGLTPENAEKFARDLIENIDFVADTPS